MKFTTSFILAFIASAQAAAPQKGFVTIGKYANSPLESPEGKLEVTQGENGSIKITGKVAGMDVETCSKDDGCGIHIHSGHNCESNGGHYYYGVLKAQEPWLVTKYKTNADGTADVDVEAKDVSLEKSFGRAVVLHTGSKRVACGIIEPEGLGTTVLGAHLKPYQDVEVGTAVGKITLADESKLNIKAIKKTDTTSAILIETEATGAITGMVVADSCPDELTEVIDGIEITANEETALEENAFETLKNNAFQITIAGADGEAAKTYCTRLTDKNDVSGYVYFYEDDDEKLNYVGHANGMEISEREISAGWHVHVGKTCDTNEVGGHLLTGEGDNAEDPWKDLKYKVVQSTVANNEDKEDGRTYFKGTVEGASLEFISDRTVVTHAENGAVRSGCGELNVLGEDTSAASAASISLTAAFAAVARYFMA